MTKKLESDLKKYVDSLSFITSLSAENSLDKITPLASDAKLWHDDKKTSEALFFYSASKRIKLTDSLLAIVARPLAKREVRASLAKLNKNEKEAGIKRKDLLRSVESSGLLTPGSRIEEWPKRNGEDLTPLEIFITPTTDGPKLFLNAYHIRAMSLVEVFRESMLALGHPEAANLYQTLVLAYGGVDTAVLNAGSRYREFSLKPLPQDDELLCGSFVGSVLRGDVLDREPFASIDKDLLEHPAGRKWLPLSGPDQLQAIVILGAWLRMARLGVSMSSRANLLRWREFSTFAGYGHYREKGGTDLIGRPGEAGEVWGLTDEQNEERKEVYSFFPDWYTSDELPWLKYGGGSPLVFAGIAAHAIDRALDKFSILDALPDELHMPKDDSDEEIRRFEDTMNQPITPNRDLIELRREFQAIISSPIASAYRLKIRD